VKGSRYCILHRKPESTDQLGQSDNRSAEGQGDADEQGTAGNELGRGESDDEYANDAEVEAGEEAGETEGKTDPTAETVEQRWDLDPGRVALRTRGKQKLLQEDILYEVERIEMTMIKNGVSLTVILDCPFETQNWLLKVSCLKGMLT
jgi:hypothetical protein